MIWTFPLVWDSTILASWRSCRHRFQRAYLEQWHRPGLSIDLHAGAAFATGLEHTRLAFWNGTPPQEALDLGLTALTEHYADADPIGTVKTLSNMRWALETYFKEFPLGQDPFRIIELAGKPAIEWSFAIPLPIRHPDSDEPLIYAGRTDIVGEWAGGIYPGDEKTGSRATKSDTWALRGQFIGYCWALRRLGVPARGAICRHVLIYKSNKPKIDPYIISVPQYLSDEWYETTLRDIQEAKDLYLARAPFNKNFNEACNEYRGCTFKQVCRMPPEEVSGFLETYFERRAWSPLTRGKITNEPK